MSTGEQSERDRQRAWDLLGYVETHSAVQDWLQEIDQGGVGRRRSVRRAVLALAASVLLAVGIGGVARWYFAPPHYETRVGEQRDVLLPDGSRITLNTNTALTVRYSRAHRYIELQRGEALFSVAHNPRWPFDVEAGGTVTRAVGTQFDVYLRNSRVTVSVLEGVVQVAERQGGPDLGTAGGWQDMATIAPALARGEAVEVQQHGREVIAQKADLQRIDAWRARRLEFTDTPLSAAVEEFNHYSGTHLVIGTADLAQVHVSGVFQIGDVDGFLFSLKETLGVLALKSSGEITLMRAPDDDRRQAISTAIELRQ